MRRVLAACLLAAGCAGAETEAAPEAPAEPASEAGSAKAEAELADDPSEPSATQSKCDPELRAAMEAAEAGARLRVQVELVDGADPDALLAQLPAGEYVELRRMESMPVIVLEASPAALEALDKARGVSRVALDDHGGLGGGGGGGG